MKLKFVHTMRSVEGWLGSRMAWRVVLGLFVLEAVWFVLSAQYPMAFDENYHFGLIQLHAQQWLPFFTSQPHDASAYGAIVRDPSYLYHWLMSFPYRLISAITANQPAQIIFLRFINVGMFTGALLLYRRILTRIGVSAALATSLLAVFILIPVVPFLAAHINYDNLFVFVIPVTVLLSIRLMEGFKRGVIEAQTALVLLGVLFLASLVKYPFLPVFVATGLYLLWKGWRAGVVNLGGLNGFASDFGRIGRLGRVLLVGFVVVSMGLFGERYMANLVNYHTPVPACDAVISLDECVQYGPFGRDYHYVQHKSDDFDASLVYYIGQWLYGMWYRLFFAINYNYATQPPLLVISALAIGIAVLLGLGILLKFRWLFAGKPIRQLVLWITVAYALALFYDGFSSYRKTAQPVAINGRYLIPFLPFLFAFGGMAWSSLLRTCSSAKAAIAGVVIAVFLLQGGGTMTFIVRSSDDWMWNNGLVRSVNRTVRDIASPLIIGKNVY